MITAVVMVGSEQGETSPASWIQLACRAAAKDLVLQLNKSKLVERIVIVSPEIGDIAGETPVDFIQSPLGSIHVGHYLAEIVQRFDTKRLFYIGGGGAPLLDDTTLADLLEKMAATEAGIFTNNQFASDWGGLVPAEILLKYRERLPLDNMLGWVLSTEAGLPLHTLPPSAASRMDIDTPIDLLVLQVHPKTKSTLRSCLNQLELNTSNLESLLNVLAKPANQVMIAGRLGPEAWQAVNRSTQCWIRVFSEERGMVSSGRLAHREVFSVLGNYLDEIGIYRFFDMLSKHVQAALIDSRILLAHRGNWPTNNDRFNSDLGLVDQIQDSWLREFTKVAQESPIPIILGGHGLMSGDLFAISDFMVTRRGGAQG